MTPAMHYRVKDLLEGAGLTDGFTVQNLLWDDSGKITDRFIVVRPSGGSNIDPTLSSDYYVLVDVISAKGLAEYKKADETVQRIIEYVQQNPVSPCVGKIDNLGGIPSPVTTTEKRLVYRLQFVCTYGE